MEKGFTIPILDKGYVRYIDHLGSDQRIVETARVCYQSPSKGPEADKKLLHYLYTHEHMTPFESCNITFNIKMPIFCMRQFIRHRTFKCNETSLRYTEAKNEFYLPKTWRRQSDTNRQGSGTHFNEITNMIYSDRIAEFYERCSQEYSYLVSMGVAREQARIVLPLSLYTEIYVNCDLRNLLHFLELRTDSHAQEEIRDVAFALLKITTELFPWTMEIVNYEGAYV
jgi:thymidylate synthase (FAD)